MQHLRKQVATAISARSLDSLFVLVYMFGFFGARLFSAFTDEPLYSHQPTHPMWYMWLVGPLTFYGGALAGGSVGFLFCRWNRMPWMQLLDCIVPAVLLALCIGRIGCFLNGDDFGIPIPLKPGASIPWWAVTFPNHTLLIARYPVQLMESGGSLLLVLMCRRLCLLPLPSGGSGIFGIMGYGVLRFFLEYWRGDLRGWIIPHVLSPAQLVSLVLVGACGVSLYRQRRACFL